MKKIILSIIGIVSFICTYAQLQQANFNATTIPSGWSATATGGTCSWQFGYTGDMPGSGLINPSSFPSGAALFKAEDCANSVTTTATLEGPEIDLNALGITGAQIEVEFNHKVFFGNGLFYIDVWNGSSWQNVLTVTNDVPAKDSGINHLETIDVSSHINSNFKVRFSYDNESATNTFGVGIDDYVLRSTATAGIDELINEGFRYYPNPLINNNLNLSANENISAVEVYNIIGQKIINLKPNTNSLEVTLHHYPTGTYIVNVAIGEKRGSFKILKQ